MKGNILNTRIIIACLRVKPNKSITNNISGFNSTPINVVTILSVTINKNNNIVHIKLFIILAGVRGIEPLHGWFKAISVPTSANPYNLVGPEGIEPSSTG